MSLIFHLQYFHKLLLLEALPFCFREHYWDWNNDNLGVPDLGQINITFPDWKIKQIRRAYYSSGMAAGAGAGNHSKKLST